MKHTNLIDNRNVSERVNAAVNMVWLDNFDKYNHSVKLAMSKLTWYFTEQSTAAALAESEKAADKTAVNTADENAVIDDSRDNMIYARQLRIAAARRMTAAERVNAALAVIWLDGENAEKNAAAARHAAWKTAIREKNAAADKAAAAARKAAADEKNAAAALAWKHISDNLHKYGVNAADSAAALANQFYAARYTDKRQITAAENAADKGYAAAALDKALINHYSNTAADSVNSWDMERIYQFTDKLTYGIMNTAADENAAADDLAYTVYQQYADSMIYAAVKRLAASAAYTALKYVSMYDNAVLTTLWHGTPSGAAGKWIDSIKAAIYRSEHTHNYDNDNAAIAAANMTAAAARLAAENDENAADDLATDYAAEINRMEVYAADSAAAAADDIISACMISGIEWLNGVCKYERQTKTPLFKHMYHGGRTAIRKAAADAGKTAARQAAEIAAEQKTDEENAADDLAAEKTAYQQYAADSAADSAADIIAQIAAQLPPKDKHIWQAIIACNGNNAAAAARLRCSDSIIRRVAAAAARLAVKMKLI